MEIKQKPEQTDEIDLAQFFAKIGQFFANMGFGLLRFLALIRKVPMDNKLLFVAAAVVTVTVTVVYGTLLKKALYESTMILSSDYLNKRIVDNTVKKLNLLADEQNKRGLAKVLDVSDSLANNIARFEAKPFVAEADLIELEVLKEQLKNAQGDQKNAKVIDQVIQRIEIENRHAFEITVRTYNPTAIPRLEEALVGYFRGNAYIRKRIETNRLILRQKKTKLDKELQKLDSLKGAIYTNYKAMAEQARQGSNNVILSDRAVTDPIEVYNQDIILYNERQNIDRLLLVEPDFEVIDGFTEFSEPASVSLVNMILQAILISIGLSYLIVALRQFNKYLANIS